jgi:CheY-like chemotaxis protein
LSESPLSEPRAPGPTSVLLVTARPEDAFVFEAVLTPLGCPLLRATTGQEAVRLAADRDPAVVLLDAVLPDMDGVETVDLLRMRRRTRATPVLLHCTRELTREQLRAAFDAGVVDVVTKPFDGEVLRARVAAFVQLHLERARTDATVMELRAQVREARARAAQAELELVSAQARVRLAADAASAGLWDYDPRRGQVRLDPQASHMFGRPPYALVELGTWLEGVDVAGRRRFDDALARALEAGVGAGRLALDLVVRGGNHVWEARRLSLRASVVDGGGGEVLVVGAVTELGPESTPTHALARAGSKP